MKVDSRYVPHIDRDLLLVTVQRTGTRFVQRLLREGGITTAQIHAVATRSKQLDGWIEKNKKEGLPIIVSLRHPLSVAQSWLHRAANNEPKEFQFDRMMDQWAYLVEIVAASKPLFLPVDHPEKESYLDEMARYVGQPLDTDWEKYGHRPGSEDVKLSKADIDGINELIATTFLADFYDEVPHGT